MTEEQSLEIRALMSLFAKSVWKDLHVRTATIELFLAKVDGIANPMATDGAVVGDAVRAPHLATIVSLVDPGTIVSIGDKVGVIELLQDRIDLITPSAGMVRSALVSAGDLVDYDQPLLSLTA